MNSSDLKTGKRVLSGSTSCCNCGVSMKPTETDLCDECTDSLMTLVGSDTVDMYGLPIGKAENS